MGVQNLWQLLGPTARPTKLQALEGKRLAIDISIWLHQATKGVRNTRNGHVMVLYNRICKLLYFKVKPIFVFDGPNVPRLKARILQERQKRRNVAANKAKELELKIQNNIIESYALQTVLGDSVDDHVRDKSLKLAKDLLRRQQDDAKDLFELPAQANLMESDEDATSSEVELAEVANLVDDSNGGAADAEQAGHQLPFAIQNMEDMDQEVFEALPADIKIEILTNYKEKLKSRKSYSYEQFPEKSQDFSQYQMKLLLRKNEVTSKINSIKSAANAEYTADLPFENVFLSKVASEDDKELILLTRKETNVLRRSPILEETEKNSPSNDIISQLENEKDPLLFKTKLEQCLESNLIKSRQLEREEELIRESEKMEKRKNSDECVIEFDYNNRIKLVSRYQKEQEGSDDDVGEVTEPKKSAFSDEKPATTAQETGQMPCTSASLSQPAYVSPIKTAGSSTEEEASKQIVTPSTYCAALTSKMSLNQDDSDSESDEDFVEVEDDEVAILKNRPELIPDIRPETSKPSSQSQTPRKVLPMESEAPEKPEAVVDKNSTETGDNNVLNNYKNYDLSELGSYRENLLAETETIARERQEQERLSNKIESSVTEDAKQLLRLFGLPYITSPGEAEAQCAYLDLANQTDGTITEDSDVWLFGGKRVYKNFFSTDQFIDSFSDSAIQSQLGLDRESLICIAYLVGSDYTEGIEGVGIVKAVEILQEFEGTHLEKLKNFKNWHSTAKDAKNLSKLRAQLAKLELPDDFPNQLIYRAYMEPDLDKSKEAFEWGMPELDAIRKFLNNKLNWSAKKIDDGLLPVIKRMNEKRIQQPIEAFLSFDALNSAFNKQSKRMQSAITSLKQKSKSDTQQQANSSSRDDEDLNLSEKEEDESFNELMETKSSYFPASKSGPKTKTTISSKRPNRTKTLISITKKSTKTTTAKTGGVTNVELISDSGSDDQDDVGSKRKSPNSAPTSSNKLRKRGSK